MFGVLFVGMMGWNRWKEHADTKLVGKTVEAIKKIRMRIETA